MCIATMLMLPALALSGCGQKATVSETNSADVNDINYLISELSTPSVPKQRKAMMWIRKLKPSEAQAALPKLQEIAAKTKDPKVKEDAEQTIAYINGG
jgi:hypothetical protein